MEGRLVCREWKVVLFSSPKVTQGLVGCADNNVKSLQFNPGKTPACLHFKSCSGF